MNGTIDVRLLRRAFTNLDREQHHVATRPPRIAEIFSPADHEGALDPHRAIVIGDRGTGKSFWSSVLIDDASKQRAAESYPRLGLPGVHFRLGFSSDTISADYPAPQEIADVMAQGFPAELLWRAVLIRFAPVVPAAVPASSATWMEWVQWIASDPAHRNAVLRELDAMLVASGGTYVLVFDSLDVIAKSWDAIRQQVESLLSLALAVGTALRRVRLKLFIRPDMADDRRMWMVGDASKLRHNEVQLRWTRRDLYGLLWTYVANPLAGHADEDAAEAFRRLSAMAIGQPFRQDVDGLWRLPEGLRENESGQRSLFHQLAGPFMGAGNKTGDTYLWVPNHLADAAGHAAPRSFLLAMRKAAEESRSDNKVLDRNGIEDGVREASKIRLAELAEDYRWMHDVLGSLAALTVPIWPKDLSSRWKERNILDKLRQAAAGNSSDRRFIPPAAVLEAPNEEEAYQHLIKSLISLRIVLEIPDGRINMPDLFRIEANVKRRGGMKPRQ